MQCCMSCGIITHSTHSLLNALLAWLTVFMGRSAVAEPVDSAAEGYNSTVVLQIVFAECNSHGMKSSQQLPLQLLLFQT